MASVAFSAISTGTYDEHGYTYPLRQITVTVDEEGVYQSPVGGTPTLSGPYNAYLDGCRGFLLGVLSDSVSPTPTYSYPLLNVLYQTYSVTTMSGVSNCSDLLANISKDEYITAGEIWHIYATSGEVFNSNIAVPITGTVTHFFASAPTCVVFGRNNSIVAGPPADPVAGCVPTLGVTGKCQPNYNSGPFISQGFGGGVLNPTPGYAVLDQTDVIKSEGWRTYCTFNAPNPSYGSTWGGVIQMNGALPVPTTIIVALYVGLYTSGDVRPILRMLVNTGEEYVIWTGTPSYGLTYHDLVETATVSYTVPDGTYGYTISVDFESWNGTAWERGYSGGYSISVDFAGLLSDTQPCPLPEAHSTAGWAYCPAFTSVPVALI